MTTTWPRSRSQSGSDADQLDDPEKPGASSPSRPARLGPRGWWRRSGIVGPRVARIPPFHLGFHRGPRSLPEARKVAGNLHRPMRRREQMQGERQLAVGDRWMLGEPEQLLHADVQGGCTRRVVVDGMTVARGRLEMRRSLILQALLQVPWQ